MTVQSLVKFVLEELALVNLSLPYLFHVMPWEILLILEAALYCEITTGIPISHQLVFDKCHKICTK